MCDAFPKTKAAAKIAVVRAFIRINSAEVRQFKRSLTVSFENQRYGLSNGRVATAAEEPAVVGLHRPFVGHNIQDIRVSGMEGERHDRPRSRAAPAQERKRDQPTCSQSEPHHIHRSRGGGDEA